jgi:hypothetical protein
VNGICGCGLPVRCCQPAVAGGVIYADLRVSLTLTWPCRLCLLRVLLCMSFCYKLSPSKHTGGGDTAFTFSGLRVCLQLTWEVGLPPSPVEFSSLCHSHKLFSSWFLGTRPRSRWNLSGQPWLVYLQFQEESPPPLRRSVHPTLFPTCLYCSYCLLLSFSFFLRWGSVCPGGYADLAQGCLWKYCVPLSSPCPPLPKPSVHGRLVAAQGPSWFLRST